MAKALFSAILLICSTSLGWSAEFYSSVKKSNGVFQNVSIEIVGEIVAGDGRRFENFVRQILLRNLLRSTFSGKRWVIDEIGVYSPGGQVSEAIKIGVFVRRLGLLTWSPSRGTDIWYCSSSENVETGSDNCICASACALIWFGGLERLGSVGVHRSFLPQSEISFSEYEKALAISHQEISQYLREIRVSRTVVEEILGTASLELTILDSNDENIYIDSVYYEFLVSQCGQATTGPVTERILHLRGNNSLTTDQRRELSLLEGFRKNLSRCLRKSASFARYEKQNDYLQTDFLNVKNSSLMPWQYDWTTPND